MADVLWAENDDGSFVPARFFEEALDEKALSAIDWRKSGFLKQGLTKLNGG